MPHFGHGKPRSSRHVATSVEVRAAIRDSRCHSRHSGVGLARHHDRRRGDLLWRLLYWSTAISQVVFAFSLHVSAGGRVLLFISGAAALILAVLCFRSLQQSILLLAIWIGVGFIFRGVATAVSAISDPTLPGRAWEIFIGVISLVAGVVMLRVAVRIDRDADHGRRHLADRHRLLRGGLRLRHPQSGQGRRSVCGKS